LKDVDKLFKGEQQVNRIMANINLKIYDFSAAKAQIDRKKKFREAFTKHFKDQIEEYQLKMKHENLVDEDAAKDPLEGIPPEEKELIDAFLSCFILNSDSGSKVDQIDIKQALKALPKRIDETNLFRCV